MILVYKKVDFPEKRKRKSLRFNLLEYPICIELNPCVNKVRLKSGVRGGVEYVEIHFTGYRVNLDYGIYVKFDSLQYKQGNQITKNENYLVIKSVREYYQKEIYDNYPRSFARARALISQYLKINPFMIDANYNEFKFNESDIHQDLQEFDEYQIYDKL